MCIDNNLQGELLIKVLEIYKEKWEKGNTYNAPEISDLVAECDDYILELRNCPTDSTLSRITDSINRYADIIAENNTAQLNDLATKLSKI